MDVLEQLAAKPGQLTVGGKTYNILPPTPGDVLRELLQMKQLARAVCRDPVDIVAARAASLPPAVFAALAQEALKLSGGGGAEPNESAVRERYALPDGVRWRLWYHITRSGGTITEDEAKAAVTEFNCIEMCDAIDRALQMPPTDPKKDIPPLVNGSNG